MNKIPKTILEALKEGGRLLALALVSYILTDVALENIINYLFGTYLSPEAKIQIISIATIVLRGLDKYLHELGKATGNDQMQKGLTQF